MWSRKYEKCVVCETTEKKYYASGMCRKCYSKKWKKENSEKQNMYSKRWRENNELKYNETIEKWRKTDRGKECIKKQNVSEKHKESIRKSHLNRIYNDPHYKLKCNISNLVRLKLHSRLYSKNGKTTFSFLPYTIDDLIRHLEKLFKTGMSWTNYGEWHIDHIRPDCKFDYKNVEDEGFQKCWALENLQPLWAEENLRKSGKY